MPKKNLLVCFDAFGTLFTPRKPVAQQYSEVASSFGLGGFSDDDIAKSFRKAFKHESKHNPNYGKATGLGAEKWWSNIIHNTLKPYYQPGQHQPPPNLIPSLIHRFHSKEGYTLYPDVLPILKQLRTTHQHHQRQQSPEPYTLGRVVIGIITNSDNRTADILTSLGVCVNPLHYGQQQPNPRSNPNHPKTIEETEQQHDIDFTVLSYHVGHEKPSKQIFTAAEEMWRSLLQTDPQKGDELEWTKMYVGDEFEKDVVGATRAGWKAVLVDRQSAGKQERVEWLHARRAGPGGGVLDVFEEKEAVGCGSLGELEEWLPGRG